LVSIALKLLDHYLALAQAGSPIKGKNPPVKEETPTPSRYAYAVLVPINKYM